MKYSIIVPIFNVKEYIENTINSVLRQTAPYDTELILVDDGSTDGSGEIIDKIKEDYNGNIKIIVVHQENRGCAAARNTGIEHSSGDWIILLDGDDMLTENALELFNDIISRNNGVDMVMTSALDLYNGEPRAVQNPYIPIIDKEVSVTGNNVKFVLYSLNRKYNHVPWRTAYRRDVIGNERFDETMLVYDDTDFVLRVYQNSKYLVISPEISYKRIFREDSITATKGNRTFHYYSKILAKWDLNTSDKYILCYLIWYYYNFFKKEYETYKNTECDFTKQIKDALKSWGVPDCVDAVDFFCSEQKIAPLSKCLHRFQSQLESLNAKNSSNNLRVCLVTQAKMENKYIGEWIRYHMRLGFNKIVIIDNNDTKGKFTENIMDVAEVKQGVNYGFIDIIPMHDRRSLQQASFLSVYKEYRKQFDWFLFIDVDEFLTLKTAATVQGFLQKPCFIGYNMIGLCWRLYGDNGHVRVTDNNYSLLERFTKPINPADKGVIHKKSFVKSLDTDEVVFPNSHSMLTPYTVACNAAGKEDLNPTSVKLSGDLITYENAYLKHFITKTLQEYITNKMKRGGSANANFATRQKYNIDYFFKYNEMTDEKKAFLKENGISI